MNMKFGCIMSNTAYRKLKRETVPVNDVETRHHVLNLNKQRTIYVSTMVFSKGFCIETNGTFVFVYKGHTMTLLKKLYKKSDTYERCRLTIQ